MNKLIQLCSLSILLAAWPKAAWSAPNIDFVKNLEHKLKALDQAVQSTVENQSVGIPSSELPIHDAEEPTNELWLHKNFWIRLRLRFGATIPGFLQIQAVPEIEAHWQRPDPEGWVPYKPKED